MAKLLIALIALAIVSVTPAPYNLVAGAVMIAALIAAII